jgi:hypothetical protein
MQTYRLEACGEYCEMNIAHKYNTLSLEFCELLMSCAIMVLEARKTYPQTFRLCEVKKIA